MIHEENVMVQHGEPQVVLARRVGTMPLSQSELPFTEHLCPEAFEVHSDNLCVPRQVAALLAIDFGLLCTGFQPIEQKLFGLNNMLTSGCMGRMVLEYAKTWSL